MCFYIALPPEPAAAAAAAAAATGPKKLNWGGGPEQKNVQRQKAKENGENKQKEQNKQKEKNKQNKENKQEEQNKQDKENKQEEQNKQNKENKQEQSKQNKESKQEEQNKQNINIKGGDVFDCFSSSDLDLFFSLFDLELKFLKSKVVSSKSFYDFRTNSISKDDFLKRNM